MSTTLERLQYGFDRDSRRTWRRRALSAIEDNHYGYDGLGQVVNAALGSLNLNTTAISGRPADEQAWGYDPTGNWSDFTTAQNGNPILDQHRVHDRGNRLTQIVDDPVSMLLDRSGRMLQMSPDADGQWDGAMELTWDAWNRITSVKSNGTVVGTYEYDGMGRRTTRTVSGITTYSYYSDTWRPLEERLAGQTTASIQYLWGARHRDDLVRRDRATTSGGDLDETRYVLMDYFSPAAITDASGTVTERYGFSAFGVRRIMAPDFTARSSSECAFEFGFQGQFLDTESGLIDYGYRYYSPHLGRWTCKDPIEELGGYNLYAMVGNGPVNQVDHLGLGWTENRNALGNQAAQNAFHKSFNENTDWHKQVEYCGAICESCQTGAMQTTGPFSSGSDKLDTCNPGNCPDGWKKIGEYHNHPGDQQTSYNDYAKLGQGTTSYVGTASGTYVVTKGEGDRGEPEPYGMKMEPGLGGTITTSPHPPLVDQTNYNNPTSLPILVPVRPYNH